MKLEMSHKPWVLRAETGMSQRELARRSGLSRMTISKLEREGVNNNATAQTLYKLAQALNVKVIDLFDDEKAGVA